MIPAPLEHLMKQLSRLPGLGPRSARRAALHLMVSPSAMGNLAHAMEEVARQVTTCTTCGNVDLTDPCNICTDAKRDGSLLCVVEGVSDLWAMERSGAFNGRYHVLGGLLSALEGVGPDDLRLGQLLARVEGGVVSEVILALSASVEGQTTGHFIAEKLKPHGVKVSMLAKGMPMGADVDYMDEGTLNLALTGRMAV
ncbi:MAG: recombination protein RecR [Proteobacteria bacterium]|nr:recombination protein RecR [Pseudomonadota bacterium]